MCGAPRKKFVNLNAPPNPGLTARVYDSCVKSDHPSVHICKNEPKSKSATRVHKRVKRVLNFLKKMGKRPTKMKKAKWNKKAKKGFKRIPMKKIPKIMKKYIRKYFHFDYALV